MGTVACYSVSEGDRLLFGCRLESVSGYREARDYDRHLSVIKENTMRVFDRPGPVNTDEIVDIVARQDGRYPSFVVASITGDCALRVAERARKSKVICVTCPQGMGWEIANMGTGPFADIPELKRIREQWTADGLKRVPMNITPRNREKLGELGVPIVQGTIPFFGPSFSMRLHLGQVTSLDVMAKALELVSTGTLVCLESVLMAVDAGVIPENEHVLAAAGTERGLDTAWVIKSSASANLFHPTKGARFVELLAKPGLSVQPDMNIDYVR
jgi:uncharacterized protein